MGSGRGVAGVPVRTGVKHRVIQDSILVASEDTTAAPSLTNSLCSGASLLQNKEEESKTNV